MVNKSRKIIALLVVLSIFLVILSRLFIFNNKTYNKVDLIKPKNLVNNSNFSYRDYISSNKLLNATTDVTVLNYSQVLKSNTTYNFNIKASESAGYYLLINYKCLDNSINDYIFSLRINGKTPFDEADFLTLKKSFVRNSFEKKFDRLGNELRGQYNTNQEQIYSIVKDTLGYEQQPYLFFLNNGENTISITPIDNELPITGIYFVNTNYQYSNSQTHVKKQTENAKSIIIEAEDAYSKTNPSILELSDKTSYQTSPISLEKDRFNTVGGVTWASPNDSLTYKFEVGKSGFYKIQTRYRQDFSSGLSSSRRLYINDKIYNDKTERISFKSTQGFELYTFGDGVNDFEFYFDQGKNSITLECMLGEMATALDVLNVVNQNLAYIYRKIIRITSPNPDPYRNYLLDEKLPELNDELSQQIKSLESVSEWLSYQNGKKGNENAILDTIAFQLKRFYDDNDKIPEGLAVLNSNISALASYIQQRLKQPLELDYINIYPANSTIKHQNNNFFGQLQFDIKSFILTFTKQYNNIGDISNKDNIDVWITSSRDDAQTLKRLIDDDFAPNKKIHVNLKLVQQSSLMPSVISNVGPDVTVFNPIGDAVNYAVRGAVKDLSKLNEFKQLENEFYESSLTPLRYNGGVYGMPEQQSFPIMLYRSDIFEELQLSIPKNWKQVYDVMFTLQKNNMDFGLPSNMSTFAMLLYQNGGDFYSEDNKKTVITSDSGYKAFEEWTNFFTDFSIPITYNFLNRFRSGEMPVGIVDYTMLNSIVVFAPELKNKWGIAKVPATEIGGKANSSVVSTGTCSLIYNNTKNEDSSWEFVKWWCSENTQSRFARDIETILGPQARYPLANKKAFENSLWTKSQKQSIKEQWAEVKGIKEIPGSYFLSRNLDNAFRRVVFYKAEPNETLSKYAKTIDLEIAEKRVELNLN